MYRQIYKGASAEAVIGAFFDEVDTNRNQIASLEEKTKHFKSVIRKHRGQVEFLAAEEAQDWLVFNDVNKDGRVTREEYLAHHKEIQKIYADGLEEGLCDEDGCHPDVKRNVLAGHLHGIDSAYVANNMYGDGYEDDEDHHDEV